MLRDIMMKIFFPVEDIGRYRTEPMQDSPTRSISNVSGPFFARHSMLSYKRPFMSPLYWSYPYKNPGVCYCKSGLYTTCTVHTYIRSRQREMFVNTIVPCKSNNCVVYTWSIVLIFIKIYWIGTPVVLFKNMHI